ncbi:unnamed protein product [Kuraishia capsulata CBS 1993]|uniref:Uncharacterized protein n=1 Tax=Kuraishia capsulata CBS 1993 TaxID=1382522 RepID=W6MIW3_9ASCO|nr:uncharacterized protein KUCA_T00000292001 [Kuraishia capsulata CBS 1993]CDK24332.1 unnamed protein product [Kuraishia capsulata CBS 1993]
MIIPESILQKLTDFSETATCPNKMLSALEKRSVTSTVNSFKSWDTCMDNKVCKIVAIVGIVLACLVVMWLVSTIVRCLCCGLECMASMCFCCAPRRQQQYSQPPVMMRNADNHNPYDNPNMYPPQYPQPTAFSRNYAPVNPVSHENPFEEKQYAQVYNRENPTVDTNTRANNNNSNLDYYNEYVELNNMPNASRRY